MADRPAPRPGLYYPKMSATWWLSRPGYIRFMVRELTSVFIAIFLVVLLVQLSRVAQGPAAYQAYLDMLRSPGWVLFHVIALLFAIYHSVTWLKVIGVVQVVRLGEQQVPPTLVTAGAFAAWIGATVIILCWFVMRS